MMRQTNANENNTKIIKKMRIMNIDASPRAIITFSKGAPCPEPLTLPNGLDYAKGQNIFGGLYGLRATSGEN
jgi:hypothetical protein